MDRVKRICYLSPMRAAKVQASLRIRAVSPEPPLFAHTSSESRGTFRQKARSQAPLNGWACAVKICHDGMLEDTNSLCGAHIIFTRSLTSGRTNWGTSVNVTAKNFIWMYLRFAWSKKRFWWKITRNLLEEINILTMFNNLSNLNLAEVKLMTLSIFMSLFQLPSIYHVYDKEKYLKPH